MAVTAYLEAARVLRIEGAREFALLTLSRLLAQAWDGADSLFHVIAYPEGAALTDRVPGTLDDYAFTVHACIDGWLAGGEMKFYHAAIKLADAMIARFYDHTAGAFYDASCAGEGNHAAWRIRRSAQASARFAYAGGQSHAAAALLRLEALSGRTAYREIAEDTLVRSRALSNTSASMRAATGLLSSATSRSDSGGRGGTGEEAKRLEATAVSGFAVNKTVVRLAPTQLVAGNLPEALAETLLQVPVPAVRRRGRWSAVDAPACRR